MTHQQAVTALASERYLLGEMSEIERFSFEEHYFSCSECAEDVRLGARMREGVREGSLGGGTGAASVRSDWRSAVLPWAAAASLVLVVGYQQFVAMPALRGPSGPQALSPVALRPASRGADPIARVGAGAVTLVVDIVDVRNDARGELAYTLLDAAGQQVASGTLPPPALGTPLLLMIPRSTFTSPGRYILSVDNTEYPFVVELF